MKKVLCILLCLCMVTALLAGCGGEPAGAPSGNDGPTGNQPSGNDTPGGNQPSGSAPSDEVIEINLSLSFPEVSADGVKKWIDEVVEASGGRLKFNIYYSYSLVAMPDLIKGLQTGIVDMAGIVPYEYPSLFTLSGNVFSMPFVGWADQTNASEVYWEMVKDCPEILAEYESYDLHYVCGYMMPGYNMFMTKAGPMEVPADLKGHKTITVAPAVQQFLAANSAAPVSAAPPDYYSNMEKGVADSIVTHINVLGAFGVSPELVEKAVFFNDKLSGAYMVLNSTVFANSFWEKLPADIQEIFNEHAPNLGKYMIEADMNLTKKLLVDLEEKGAEMVVLNDEQVQVWADALTANTQSNLEEWNAMNPAAESIYNTMLEKIAASK